MTPAFVVEIKTPKGFLLNGLWFGPQRPQRTIVFVHGLTGSVFSARHIVDALVDKKTAVLTFNNRGSGIVNRVKNGAHTSIIGGAAHEVFTDSADDVEGAVRFARKSGSREIYLAGHSTGCQKVVYWNYKKGGGVNGIILIAPVSDWAAEVKLEGKKNVLRTLAHAHRLVTAGKSKQFLPHKWHSVLDAQRYVSIFDPNSIEEIFPYAQQGKTPRLLKSVKKPVLVLWAEKDEYADRSPKEIKDWFVRNLQNAEVHSVPKAKHSFKGAEKRVATTIRKFMQGK